jgi:S1-C subfamily serine protease
MTVSEQKPNEQEYVYYSYKEREQQPTEPEVIEGQSAPQWSYEKPKKRGVGKAFAVSIVVVVAVSSLLYMSDRNDWFGGNDTRVVDLTPNASPSNQVNQSDNVGSQVVRPGNISSIVQASSPAVVKIETYKKATSSSGNGTGNDFFNQFFSDEQQPNQDGYIADGIGTGFIFDKAGYILTNQHVIEGADQVQVTVEGYSKPFVAKVLGTSSDLDLAVVQISGKQDFSTLTLGDDAKSNVGDWLVAIGNPYGFDHTVTVGVLSAKERPITISENNETRRYKNLLQTDASINPGNSGGPLLNLKGEVVGINTAVSTDAQGIGFAIPVSTVKSVITSLKNDAKLPKPYIGIYMSNIDSSWLGQLKLTSTDGVLVESVLANSPAKAAGLKQYDVILKMNGKVIKDTDGLSDFISTTKVGEKIQMKIWRDGKAIKKTITVGNQNHS